MHIYRIALFFSLILGLSLGLSLDALAQDTGVPGMPSDPTRAEPQAPPRLESDPPPTQPLPPPGQPAADVDAEGVPRPPVLPEPVESGEPLEPEITIIHKDGAEIEEYRVHGRLYMVKITPDVGVPYYLVDRDGDGRLETRQAGLDDPLVPQWVIFSW